MCLGVVCFVARALYVHMEYKEGVELTAATPVIWEFPKTGGTLFWGSYNNHPTM